MLKYIQFECKKALKSPIFSLLLIIAVSVIGLYYVFVHVSTQSIYDNLIMTNENMASDFQLFISDNIELIESGNLSSEEIADQEQQNKHLQTQVDLSEKKANLYKEKDWQSLLAFQMELDEEYRDQAKTFQPFEITVGGRSFYSYETGMAQNQLLLDRGIKPVLPIDFTYTIKDYSTNQTELMEERAVRHDSSGLYFTYEMTGILFGFVGIVFFMLLFGDIVNKESFGGFGSANLLFTQPISRSKILNGKWLTVMIGSGLILISICLLSILIGTVFDRFGDLDYPILIYGEELEYSFTNLGTFLLQSLVLFFLALLFSYSLLFLFSLLMKNTLAAVVSTITLIFVGIELSSHDYLASIAHYIPFSYFNVHEVLKQEAAFNMDN